MQAGIVFLISTAIAIEFRQQITNINVALKNSWCIQLLIQKREVD
jgi:hypothetical protein